MRIVKTSTTGHLSKRRKSVFRPGPEVLDAFRKLIAILKPYEDYMETVANTDDHFELWTNNGYRTSSFNPKRKRGIQFAACLLYEDHVGFYFLPLYISSDMRGQLTPDLQKALTGQSCFHFRSLSEDLEQQVRNLVASGWDFYRKEQIVTGATKKGR